MGIVFDSFSCTGEKNPNEDNVAAEILGSGIGLFAIADGMGGQQGGELASHIAVSNAISLLRDEPSISFGEVFQHIRQKLILEADSNPDLSRMGTTLTLCRIEKASVEVGHVGDTRLYQLRGQGLRTLTKDQTELQKLIDEGVLTKQRAKTYPRRHILVSVLSPNSNYELEGNRYEISSGDRLLLVTDGVYNVVTKAEIKDLSLQSRDITSLCGSLRKLIESKDHKDDYSAVCIEIL